MSEKLKDPSKAAHEIIEVLEDGDAIRNDGERLTAANKNPWYVLATIYGEQEGKIDHELAARNRRAWNGWFCGGLSEDAHKERADKVGVDVADLKKLTQAEQADTKTRLITRLTDAGVEDPTLPDPSQGISFSKIYFLKDLCLEKYIFENSVIFSGSQFNRLATFRNAQFNKVAIFIGSKFSGETDFINTHFKMNSSFGGAQFTKGAHFIGSKFDEDTSFLNVQFNGGAIFSNSKFEGVAFFSDAQFGNDTSFRKGQFNGFAFFNGARFGYDVDFSSAIFNSSTEFDTTNFLTHVPQFHAAKLYEDTTFTLPDNYRKNWPPLIGKDVMPAADQKRAYNRLRLFMNKSLQIEEEQFFHRQEMRCKAVLAKWYHKPLYWLFSIFSDYGNSVWRPIAWGALSVVAAAVFMLWWQGVFAFMPQEAGMDWTFGLLGKEDTLAATRKAFGWSVSNTLPFIGTGKLYYGGEFAAELAWPLRVIGGVQTLFGFVLLFLFGLGLRNRFRLR